MVQKKVNLISTLLIYELEGFERDAVKIELDGDNQCCTATIFDSKGRAIFVSEKNEIYPNFHEDEENDVPEWTFPIFEELGFIN